MATIQGHKNILSGGTWSDDYEFSSGPQVHLEDTNIDKIADMLPNLWAKGWQWATVYTNHYTFTFHKGGNMFMKKRDD